MSLSSATGLPVELKRVKHTYAGQAGGAASAASRLVLTDIQLEIPAGEFVAIVGPSGSGKSTLLRLMAGLELPTSGELTVGDTAANAARGSAENGFAYVFQDAHLLPWRNVSGNVALPLELRGVSDAERTTRAQAALEPLGLADRSAAFPAQLSGGMKMRVSLARALVTSPRLLLLDEPFAALDEVIRFRLAENLRQLWMKHRMTVVFVTHSISEAVYLANRVVVLSAGPGRVVLDRPVGLPEERTAALRTQAKFAEETRVYYEALSE